MEIRVVVGKDGTAEVEALSALEDLWHDFRYFRDVAAELDAPDRTPTERLLAQRQRRAALLALVSYFEGVLNHWLVDLIPRDEWQKLERVCVERKVERVEQCLGNAKAMPLDLREPKRLRNMLAHLKPGTDGELFDRIDAKLLQEAEIQISGWLAAIESTLGLQRHPDTRSVSRDISSALGTVVDGSEGYTAQE